MEDELIRTAPQFLAEEVYMPGYMALSNENYDKKGATFDFRVKEPPVIRGSIINYFTPRGLHICISQAGYALVEYMVREGLIEGFEVPTLRKTLLEGRVKITDLYQKFRKEIEVSKLIPGRLNIRKFRAGKMPVLKLDFSFANGGITGNLISVITPKPVPQTNIDIARKCSIKSNN